MALKFIPHHITHHQELNLIPVGSMGLGMRSAQLGGDLWGGCGVDALEEISIATEKLLSLIVMFSRRPRSSSQLNTVG